MIRYKNSHRWVKIVHLGILFFDNFGKNWCIEQSKINDKDN